MDNPELSKVKTEVEAEAKAERSKIVAVIDQYPGQAAVLVASGALLGWLAHLIHL